MARRVTGGMEVTGGIKALKHGGKDRRRDSTKDRPKDRSKEGGIEG